MHLLLLLPLRVQLQNNNNRNTDVCMCVCVCARAYLYYCGIPMRRNKRLGEWESFTMRRRFIPCADRTKQYIYYIPIRVYIGIYVDMTYYGAGYLYDPKTRQLAVLGPHNATLCVRGTHCFDIQIVRPFSANYPRKSERGSHRKRNIVRVYECVAAAYRYNIIIIVIRNIIYTYFIL